MPTKKLNTQQLLFCLEYLKMDKPEATKAAILAGYSKKTAHSHASRMLNDVKYAHVQDYIKKINKKRFKKLELDGDDILEKYLKIANSDITDYVDVDSEGYTKCKSLDQMKNTGVISGIKEKRVIKQTGSGEDMVLDNTFEFKMWDKMKALDGLSRHLGLFNDTLKLEVEDYSAILSKARKRSGRKD